MLLMLSMLLACWQLLITKPYKLLLKVEVVIGNFADNFCTAYQETGPELNGLNHCSQTAVIASQLQCPYNKCYLTSSALNRKIARKL